MIIIGALLVTAATITFGTATVVVLEPEVWVNAAWAGSANGDVVDGIHVFGINATDTISNGSSMVDEFGKINIAPGNYPENIVIDKPLILNGSQSGVPGNDSSRGTGEVAIGGISPAAGYTYGITINSPDVVVDGLTVTGYDIGIGTIEGSGPFNNITIINNRMLNSANSGINVSATDSNVEDNLVQGVGSGTAIVVDSGEGAPVLVNDNVVKNCFNGISYEGNGGIIQGNKVNEGTTNYHDGIVYLGDNCMISGNSIYGRNMNKPVFITGDHASFIGNDVFVDSIGLSNNMIEGVGDDVTLDDNDLWCGSLNNDINWQGENGRIINNRDSISSMKPTGITGGDIYFSQIVYVGNGSVISGNEIANMDWRYNYSIAVIGGQTTISGNHIKASDVMIDAIFVNSPEGLPVGSIVNNEINASLIQDSGIRVVGDSAVIEDNTMNTGTIGNYAIACDGQSASINGNTVKASGLIAGIYCTGDDGTIDGNELILADVRDRFVDYYGDFGTINGNMLAGMNVATPYCTGNDVISYQGVNGNITNNVIKVTGVGHNVIQYGDESMYLSSADAQQFPNYAGTIADNTLSAAFVNGAFIDYFGDAGRIQRNKDLSPYEFMWPMVDYRAALFGHGVITDNVGGAILYMGDEIPLAPYGTIANNHVNSSLIGIAAIGDYNVIRGNEINATIGTYTLGTKVLVESNDFTAIPQYIGPIPLSAGVLFDGDLCTVNDNTLNNFSFGAANVGLFKVVDIYTSGAVATEYTDKVNDSLDDSAAEIAALSALAKGYVADKFASSGEGVSVESAAALDSLGYRGYGNTISGNTLNYDDSLGIVGIVTLGYDFTVDSNTFNCVNDSSVLAGMIVGGDGGKVTDNEMSNISLLGMYYGGLLKFEDGLYTSDLLGMNAQISGNTIDNRGTESGLLSGLFPWGIVFTGYDAAIEDNDLLGLGLGVLTVQFEGSITDNCIDTFNDDPMYLPLGATGVKPLEGEVVSGLGGIISVCNNLTVTDNFVNGTLMGMLFVPIDPYTTWGNAYIDNNVLNNNMFQMAFVPSYFMFHMEDGSVKPIDTATMLEVMDQNPMDRAVYDTDELGEFCVLPLFDTGYFDISAAGVYSDIQLGVIFASICDGNTVNVRPGTYSLRNPVIVPVDELNIVGDVTAPATTVVETGMMPFIAPTKSAFEVMADNVTIKGFAIRNSNNTFEDKNYGTNSGISVGWTGPSTTSIEATPYMVYGGAFENNTFTNLTTGIYLDSSSNASIRYNLFDGNNVGVNLTLFCSPNTTEIHYNDFVDNAGYAVNNRNSLVRPESLATISINPWVNATYNWWNSYQGPHDVTDPASTSTGDNVTYFVIYDPWLTTPMYSTLYTYHLVAGWNLIGVPLDVPDTSIQGFFPAGVLDDLEVVWGWDEVAQSWVLYSSDPSDPFYGPPYNYPHLSSIDTGRAYWVYTDTEAYFQVEGTTPDCAPESPVQLVSGGWNFVSITGVCPQDVVAMYPNAEVVWGWDEVAQSWVLYSSDPSDPFYGPPYNYQHLTTVLPGYGYWVYEEAV